MSFVHKNQSPTMWVYCGQRQVLQEESHHLQALDQQAALNCSRGEPDPHTNTLHAHHSYRNEVSIKMHYKAKGLGTKWDTVPAKGQHFQIQPPMQEAGATGVTGREVPLTTARDRSSAEIPSSDICQASLPAPRRLRGMAAHISAGPRFLWGEWGCFENIGGLQSTLGCMWMKSTLMYIDN